MTVWDPSTGRERFRRGLDLGGHDFGVVSTVAFSPDARNVVSGGFDGTITMWEMASGKERVTWRASDAVFCVALSPDGKKLTSGTVDGVLTIWNLKTGKTVTLLKADEVYTNDVKFICSIAFSPDGETLASASAADKVVKLWDTSEKYLDRRWATPMGPKRAPVNQMTPEVLPPPAAAPKR